MTPFQQHVLMTLFFWLIFIFMSFGSVRTVDKQYKMKYFLTDTYKLGKIKMLFSFYNRKKGEIAKFAFWLNIITYILSVSFIWTSIMYIIFRVYPWNILVFIFLFAHLGIFIVAGGFNFYYDVKSGKKTK